MLDCLKSYEVRIRLAVAGVAALAVGCCLFLSGMFQWIAVTALGLVALAVSLKVLWWWPRVSAKLPIFVMLHCVAEEPVVPVCANNTVRPAELESLIVHLLAAGYSFKTVAEAGMCPGRRTVVLSFDDGYADNYKVLFPMLKKYGVKATCFITNFGETDPAFLTPDQVREMDASGLVEFGGHTATHQKLNQIPLETAVREIEENVSWLTRVLGKAPASFAYPCGCYSDEVTDAVKRAGYRFAVTMQKRMRPVAKNPYLIHRQILPRGKSPWQAYALVTRGKWRL